MEHPRTHQTKEQKQQTIGVNEPRLVMSGFRRIVAEREGMLRHLRLGCTAAEEFLE